MVHRELPTHARGILTHGEIHPRTEFPSVSPHLHIAGKCVDVYTERLQDHFIRARFPELLLKVLSSLVGTATRISTTLKPRRTQFLYYAFEMRKVLGRQLQGQEYRQDYQQESSVLHLLHLLSIGKNPYIICLYCSFVMGSGMFLFTSSTNWAQCSIISSIEHSCRNSPSL